MLGMTLSDYIDNSGTAQKTIGDAFRAGDENILDHKNEFEDEIVIGDTTLTESDLEDLLAGTLPDEITIGETTLTEANVIALLALLESDTPAAE